MDESVRDAIKAYSPVAVDQVSVDPEPEAHVIVEHEVEDSTTRDVLVVVHAAVLEGYECVCVLERHEHTLDTTGGTTSDGTHCDVMWTHSVCAKTTLTQSKVRPQLAVSWLP